MQLHKNIEKSPRKWNSSCKIEDEDFHVKFDGQLNGPGKGILQF